MQSVLYTRSNKKNEVEFTSNKDIKTIFFLWDMNKKDTEKEIYVVFGKQT